MEILSTWRLLYTLRYAPVLLGEVLFSAGTIFLLSAQKTTSDVSLDISLSNAELCLQYLHDVGRSFPCARELSAILKNMSEKQLQPKLTPSPVLPPADSVTDVRMTSTNPQIVISAPQPSIANDALSIPFFHDKQLSSNAFYQPDIQCEPSYTQPVHAQQNTGSSPSYNLFMPAGSPRPLGQYTVPGSHPMGLRMDGDMQPNQRFIPFGTPGPFQYHELCYQRQSQGQEPLLNEGASIRLQGFLARQRQLYDANGY
jgi:hypothetical protein